MSVKSEVSSNYLEALKAEHGAKRERTGDRVALITGTDNRGSIGETIAHELIARGVTCLRTVEDVCSEGAWHNSPAMMRRLEMADILVMCHGMMHLDWIEKAPPSKLQALCDVNLFGTINVTQAFVKATIDKPYRKKIISIGSMAYKSILNGSAAYCASKAGAAHFIRCAAWELAPKGFDVFAIHPSNTEDTPMTRETVEGLMAYRHMTYEQALAYWNDTALRDHMLSKEEIANLVAFCTTPQAQYLSGSQLELGGGQR